MGRRSLLRHHGTRQGDPTVDITELLNEWFPNRQSVAARDLPSYITVGDTRGTENIETFTDDQVLTRAATATNRDKFLRLFRGDASEYGGDQSRADQALVSILLYWCGGDRQQADRLFRQSALMRDKWNTRSYRLATLNRAASLLRRPYERPRRRTEERIDRRGQTVADHQLKEELKRRARINEEARREMKAEFRGPVPSLLGYPGSELPRIAFPPRKALLYRDGQVFFAGGEIAETFSTRGYGKTWFLDDGRVDAVSRKISHGVRCA